MAVKPQQATDVELAILKLLWDRHPLSARELRQALEPDESSSSHGTVQTLLARLEKKGLIRRDRTEFAHRYTAAVSQSSLTGRQLEGLAEKLTDGSLLPFLLHAAGSKSSHPPSGRRSSSSSKENDDREQQVKP